MRKFTLKMIVFAFVILGNSVYAQWQAVNTGLTTNNVNAVLTTGPNVLAATDAGLFLSTDNGNNWAIIPGFPTSEVKALAASGGNVFAATYGAGVFLSTDNGVTWTAKNTGFSFLYACAVATIGTKVYASMSFDGVYVSADNGTTWTETTNPVLGGITVNSIIASGPNLIISSGGCNGSSTGGVFLSTDNGLTWTATSVTGDADALAVVGTTVFTATQNGVFKSADNGATWTATTNTAGIIDNSISLFSDGSTLIAGCPYSVYTTTDNGTTWNDISTGAGAANLTVTSLSANSTYLFAGNLYHSVGVWRRPLSELGLTTGIQALNTEDKILVYPNPSTGKFYLKTEGKHNKAELYNLQGQLLNIIVLTDAVTEFESKDLAAGTYILKITGTGKNSVQRVIIR